MECSLFDLANPKDNWPELIPVFYRGQLTQESVSPMVWKNLTAHNTDIKYLCGGQLIYCKDDKELKYIPFLERMNYIQHLHDLQGHMGGNSLYDFAKECIWFPNLQSFIKEVTKRCPDCQIVRGFHRPQEPLHPLPSVPPFHCWHLDFIGQLPATKRGNAYILAAVDSATKWTVLKAVPSCEAHTIADFIYNEPF
jgi:hypothetical protein